MTRRKRFDPLLVAIVFWLCMAAFGVMAAVVYDSADTSTSINALH